MSRTRHFIPDRRMKQALESDDPEGRVRELLDEAWNNGYSAGQMKGRLEKWAPNAPADEIDRIVRGVSR